MDQTKFCENCKKEFFKPAYNSLSAWSKRRFCSRTCREKFSTEIVPCKRCTKSFQRKKYLPQIVFCSKECRVTYKREHPKEYSLFGVGHVGYKSTPWLGKKLSEETKKKMSLSRIGRKMSPECLAKRSGPNHWQWKGGITDKNAKIRASAEYIAWRNAVYERDYWTCQDCKTKPKRIVAHHINPFNDYPELRFEVSNGITLCRRCHKHRHEDIGECSRFVKQGG